jgi:heme oxygenase
MNVARCVTGMTSASWMLARLKEETRVHHSEADVIRLAPLATPTSVVAYASYLGRIHGFEAPVEDALQRMPDFAPVLEPHAWSRTHRIRDDLIALGIDPARTSSLPRCASVASFRSIAEALGWIYVVERNAPLHGIVRRHLARRMPGQVAVASDYLTFTEQQAAKRWRILGIALDEVARSPSASARIIDAAHAAFRTQQRWLRHAPSPKRSGVRVA